MPNPGCKGGLVDQNRPIWIGSKVLESFKHYEDDHWHDDDNYKLFWRYECQLLKRFVQKENLLQQAPRVRRDFLLQHSCFEVITSEWEKKRCLHCHSRYAYWNSDQTDVAMVALSHQHHVTTTVFSELARITWKN